MGKPYLDLGEQPLANSLVSPFDYTTPGPAERKFPLQVALCENCGLSQLTVVVDPNVLYEGYRFRSGVSSQWKEHCRKLAEESGPPGNVLDIACNDGACLGEFQELGWSVVGVDPCPIAKEGIPMIRAPWPDLPITPGSFDLVVAQNVLGHVDDVIGFLKGAREVLKEDGRLVVEVPMVRFLIEGLAFDTIYHEHLSYWNGYAMELVGQKAGLRSGDVQTFPDLHGGTMRFTFTRETGEPSTICYEGNAQPYEAFGHEVARRINLVSSIVSLLNGKKFLAWGASAKGAVFLNAVHNRWPALKLPSAIIDQTPEKQGFLSPGVGIPIIAPPESLSDVDIIWILSWNWLDAIRGEAEKRGFEGKYLVTSPKPKLFIPESYMGSPN